MNITLSKSFSALYFRTQDTITDTLRKTTATWQPQIAREGDGKGKQEEVAERAIDGEPYM